MSKITKDHVDNKKHLRDEDFKKRENYCRKKKQIELNILDLNL